MQLRGQEKEDQNESVSCTGGTLESRDLKVPWTSGVKILEKMEPLKGESDVVC